MTTTMRAAGPTSRSPLGGAQAARELARLHKKGRKISPVTIEGRTIARTFWGQAWCDNLERYSDFANRLPRGRSYVRNGSVVDLQVAPGHVTALVSGSTMYDVKVTVGPEPRASGSAICSGLLGRHRLARRTPAGPFLQRRDDASLRGRRRGCSRRRRTSSSRAVVRTVRRCASTWRRCCTASARGSTRARNCCSGCVRWMKLRCLPILVLLCRGRGKVLKRERQLVGDDLAALFGLDIAEGGAPAAPLPEAALLAPRKVAAKGTAARVAFGKTAPVRGKPAQKTKAAPTKAAQNKTTAARTRAKAKREASKKATTAGRKPPAKSLASMQAAAPSRLQSGPVIGNSTPVREFRSRRPVRSATLKRMIGSNGREPRGEA